MSWYRAATPSGSGRSVELVTWTNGTDEQIAAMVAAYYNGDLTLEQIQEVWSVGDKRSISISAMTATGVSESHHTDNYDYVIIDFDHDLLVEPINGIAKALITVQQDRIFFTDTTTMSDSSYDAAHEYGYINSSNVNNTGWNTCARRTWCNNAYKAALPQYIQDNLKQVYKSTAHSGNTSSPTWIANTDYCFLLSEWEIFGAKTYSAEDGTNATHYINNTSGTSLTMPKGGSKYSYFSATADRYKMPAYTGYSSSAWWERSPRSSSSGYFCGVGIGGGADASGASYTRGLAPAWCF